MTPLQLSTFLSKLLEDDLKLSAMIWGPPGIGKSSIVAQLAEAHGLGLVDVRLSQLAPTDLRGLPVPVDGMAQWYPPEFLPQEGQGILFMDELNMAPPAVQGIAQQLILDRRVGNYQVPDGWFIWAAGNRKEDRASVFDMPAPLANRFVHLPVQPDYESFRQYALAKGFHEQILAFLAFRSSLLFQFETKEPAWPSPRSWEMASQLHASDLAVAPAIGEATAGEFDAFLALYQSLPDLDAVLAGTGSDLPFPEEPSVAYAATVGLSLRAQDAEQGLRAFRWLAAQPRAEWAQLFISNLFTRMQSQGRLGELADLVSRDPEVGRFVQDFRELIGAA